MSFVFREDGYFNMTKAASHFGKRVGDYIDLPGTDEYRYALKKALEAKTGKSGISTIETKRGNGGGSWAHPKLDIHYARWLDTELAVWCDMMVEDILTKKAEVTIVKLQESAGRTGYRVTLGGMTTGRGGYRDTLGEGRTYGRQGQKSHLRRKAIATSSEEGYRHYFGEEQSRHLQREWDQSRHLRSKEMEAGSNESP